MSANSRETYFPSLKRRGGCGINKGLRSHRNAADGVVGSAGRSGLHRFAELTTPAAPHRNGSILLIAQPPLLFKAELSKDSWPCGPPPTMKKTNGNLTDARFGRDL